VIGMSEAKVDVSVDDHLVQAGQDDVDGTLGDLVTVVLAMDDEVLSPIVFARLSSIRRCAR
jgi:hypothetical protein